jgi:hypothetical protein
LLFGTLELRTKAISGLRRDASAEAVSASGVVVWGGKHRHNVTGAKLERVSEPRIEARKDAAAAPMSGLGYALVTVYVILALAATLRAVYQIITKFDEAPLAYTLSLVSGIVYIVATVALIKRTHGWRTVGILALSFELVGVLIVGTLSLTHPELFNHPSVWSWFGAGYGWVPLVLPVLGLIWLLRTGRVSEGTAADADLDDFERSIY